MVMEKSGACPIEPEFENRAHRHESLGYLMFLADLISAVMPMIHEMISPRHDRRNSKVDF